MTSALATMIYRSSHALLLFFISHFFPRRRELTNVEKVTTNIMELSIGEPIVTHVTRSWKSFPRTTLYMSAMMIHTVFPANKNSASKATETRSMNL